MPPNRRPMQQARLPPLFSVLRKGGSYAFSAAANGKLNPVAGWPFKGQLTGMAVNGRYLFGAGAGFVNIFSYSIAANGALKQVSSINAQKFTLDNCGAVFPPLFLDHTDRTCMR